MFPICGKGNSISPSFSLPRSLRPSLPLPPCESGSILLFRSLFGSRESLADVTNLVLRGNRPRPDKGFPLDRLLTQWLSLNPKLGCFSFPPPFFSLARHSRFFKAQRDQALKKHFISDPIISSA